MCGIAGWIGSEECPIGSNLFVDKAFRSLSHRGPDGKGHWISNNETVILCHTRLAIIDLSDRGAQPMSCVGGDWKIVFNGEIYNYKELRSELEKHQYIFDSNTDTEVIPAAFDFWGHDAWAKLRGMFAAVLWNESTETAYLVRDRFGIKPLYVYETSSGLCFSSELKTIKDIFSLNLTLDQQAIGGYLATGTVPEPKTMWSGVQMFRPGTVMEWKSTHVSVKKFFTELYPKNISNNQSIGPNAVRESFLNSVDAHLVSDVPVGLFLSGGIDSTAIAAALKLLNRSETACFSITFGDNELSEGSLAKRTADHFGFKHFIWELKGDEALSLFEEYLNAIDQPSIDGFNTYSVSRFAAREGYKVVMSGLGGDELFGGYASFRKIPIWMQYSKILAPVGKSFGRILQKSGSPKYKRLGDMLSKIGSWGTAYRAFRGIFSEKEVDLIFKALDFGISDSSWRKITDQEPVSCDALEKISEMEMQRYMRNQLLRDSDVMSMANGLELRVPFLDNPFFEIVSKVMPMVRYGRGKRMLLDAFPEIPDWVANAPKKGFLFPVQSWLEDSWKDKKSWIAERAAIDTHTWYRRMTLLCLEHWMKRYFGESS